MKIINRDDYVSRIGNALHKGKIIVLTGQRRVGKSYMLKLMERHLGEKESANVIFIDKEKREFGNLQAIHDNYQRFIRL